MNTPKKAVLLLRVSSKEQADGGFSLDAQRRLLTEYCHKKGILVDRVFEMAESAKSADRRKFKEVLDYLASAEDVNTLVVEKTDRLYRNFRDYVTIDEMDLEIHLVKEGEIISRDSSSHSKLVHGFKVLIAKNYIDNLSEETKKGMLERARAGWLPFKAPYGYRVDKNTKELEQVHEQVEVIREVYQRYLNGDSIGVIVKDFNSRKIPGRGAKGWYKSGVSAILNNRFYTGSFVYKEEIFEGKHEPCIEYSTWQKVQERLKSSPRSEGWIHNFNLSKLIVKPDGKVWTGEQKKGHVYYGVRENGKSVYIREDRLMNLLADEFETIKWPADLTARVKDALKDLMVKEQKEKRSRDQGAMVSLTRYENRLKRLTELFADGEIDSNEYHELRFETINKIQTIRIKMEAGHNTKVHFYEVMGNVIHLFTEVPTLFRNGNPEQKTALLRAVLSHVEMGAEKAPKPVFKAPFSWWIDNSEKVRKSKEMLPLVDDFRQYWIEAA